MTKMAASVSVNEKLSGLIGGYENKLRGEEKAENTIEKYIRDAKNFINYMKGKENSHIDPKVAFISGKAGKKEEKLRIEKNGEAKIENPDITYTGELKKEDVISYKNNLKERYKVSSINSMLIALNGFLKYAGRADCTVKTVRVQRSMFSDDERAINKSEFEKLIDTAINKNEKSMACILETIGMTGIRAGELKYITAESLDRNSAVIENKGKQRMIVLEKSLVNMLKKYCRTYGIKRGSIFINKKGEPINRKTIWSKMKKIGRDAGVATGKVFPHNLRHLFARQFYEKKKDIVRLADYLGHSSLETTRRYTQICSMEACQEELRLGLYVGSVKKIL